MIAGRYAGILVVLDGPGFVSAKERRITIDTTSARDNFAIDVQ